MRLPCVKRCTAWMNLDDGGGNSIAPSKIGQNYLGIFNQLM